jgi:polysaccharide biosynthesis protein PslH
MGEHVVQAIERAIGRRRGEAGRMSTSGGLRILVVTPSLPYPPMSGFPTRVYQIIRHLATRHHITLLSYVRPDDVEHVAPLREFCAAVHTLPHPQGRGGVKRRRQLSALFATGSYQRRRLWSQPMQAAIDRLVAGERFDIVQIESSPMAGFDLGAAVPTVLDEHNIEYELSYRIFREERSPARKLHNLVEFLKFRREEQQCWRSVAGCVVTSAREEAILHREAPQTPAIVVPNGVDTDYFRPVDVPIDRGSIVFTGAMSYRPNVDAVLNFVREVFPRILRVRPDMIFSVVGRGESPEVSRLAGSNVLVTGRVPDVRPYPSPALPALSNACRCAWVAARV